MLFGVHLNYIWPREKGVLGHAGVISGSEGEYAVGRPPKDVFRILSRSGRPAKRGSTDMKTTPLSGLRTRKKLNVGLAGLDAMFGGGLPTGALTEFTGPPGSGKTQLLIQICAKAALGGNNPLFVDGEGTFSVGRLLDMCPADKTDQIMRSVRCVSHLQGGADQLLTQLCAFAREFTQPVVCIDTLGGVVQADLSSYRNSMHLFSSLLTRLRCMAAEYEICVILSSHARVKTHYSLFGPGVSEGDPSTAYNVQNRVSLVIEGSNVFSATLVNSNEFQPTTIYYSIAKTGIRMLSK